MAMLCVLLGSIGIVDVPAVEGYVAQWGGLTPQKVRLLLLVGGRWKSSLLHASVSTWLYGNNDLDPNCQGLSEDL